MELVLFRQTQELIKGVTEIIFSSYGFYKRLGVGNAGGYQLFSKIPTYHIFSGLGTWDGCEVR